ncbi:MAG: ribosome biogenesis GTP-binding protein YihA/YsxC [Acutalibacteraceae bacterium]
MNYNNSEFLCSYGEFSQVPISQRAEIVFSGRSNVGKSSLINKICNRKNLARTSSKPGKTGTINFYSLDNIYLVDLPGYGYAKVSFSEKERWAKLVEGYFADNRNFSLVVQIVDIRHPATEQDIHMIDFLEKNGFNYIVVLTKKDKLKKSEFEKRMSEIKEQLRCFRGIKLFPFSAITGDGVEDIRTAIEDSI